MEMGYTFTHEAARALTAAETTMKGEDVKIKGHTLGAWFSHLLFKLLPPKLYLRLQGIKLPTDSPVNVTIVLRRHGEDHAKDTD